MTCGLCEDCKMNETNEIYYEAHITVGAGKKGIKDFTDDCKELRVSPILISFENAPLQVMTSCVYKKYDYHEVLSDALQVMFKFIEKGYEAKRLKIETTINNSLCDEILNGYYEAHFACEPFENNERLERLLKRLGLHKSKNLLKKDNGNIQMLTYRDDNRKHFLQHIEDCEYWIEQCHISIKKIIKEFAVFDTNREIDDEWLNLK